MRWIVNALLAPGRLWNRLGRGPRCAFGLCLIGFAAQAVVARSGAQAALLDAENNLTLLTDPLTLLLAIHGQGLARGFFWSPVTYLFLHGSWSHLLLNAVGLLAMGTALESVLGTRRFWSVFLVSGVCGGAAWALVQGLASGTPCVGASGAVLGLIGAYAVLRPHDRFLLVFPFPIELSARVLALWLALANTLDLAFGRGQIAYLAHLAGLGVGGIYGLLLRRAARRGRLRAPNGASRAPRRTARTLEDVLETIETLGIQALDETDRRILEQAAQRGLEGYPHRSDR